MTNLSKPLREKLDGLYDITAPAVARKQVSKLDGTIKYLWKLPRRQLRRVRRHAVSPRQHRLHLLRGRLPDGLQILRVDDRRPCPAARDRRSWSIRCSFPSSIPACRSPTSCSWASASRWITSTAVMRFLELVNSPDGMNIGMRHISLSTCGLVDKIEQLAERDLQLTLSVSLHSPDDESRSKIMPVNRRWPVDTLLAACRDYFAKTGRRISFEYTMIDGVSDSAGAGGAACEKARRYGRARQHDPAQQRRRKAGLHTCVPRRPSHAIPDHSGGQRHHRHAPPDARQRHRCVLRPAAPESTNKT